MRFSRSSELPAKMISMRRISLTASILQRKCRDHRVIKQSNGHAGTATAAIGGGKASGPSARPVLGEQLSASLRESLIEQLDAIKSVDEAATWAHRSLPAKNTLTAADAKIVEERFKARLSSMSDSPYGEEDGAKVARPGANASDKASRRAKKQPCSDKEARTDVVHALGKPVRLRDKDHRKFVLRQPCLVCGRVPSDPHHLTFTQPRALGRRVSDEFVVPVCRTHHRELHRSGNEAAWWRSLSIDPLPVALRLWQQTRADGEPPSVTQS